MTAQALGWALEQDLPARPKLVLVSIANHADHTNGYCWLRADTIAREASCTVRSVFNYIGALARNGYIRKAPRKGEDGKQRANDYWIIFDREKTKWEWGTHDDASEAGSEADETASTKTETQDVVSPHAPDSCGDPAQDSCGSPVEMSQDSVGPHETGFSRYNAEPSKTKPLEEEASRFAAPPRSYRPPPQPVDEPQGAIGDPKAATIFVFVGTRAWEKWVAEKRKTNPVWNLQITKVVDGVSRRGWYFESLFPPEPKAENKTTGPPTSSTMSADDAAFLETEGLRIK